MFKYPLQLVGIVLVGMFMVAGLLGDRSARGPTQGNIDAPSKAERAEGKQHDAKGTGPAPATLKDQQKAKEYEADCSKREDADLCAQRRMAKASEDQTGLNILGLVLLFFTLLATGAAALYARRAAIAARETVAIMEDTAKRQLRAYMSLHNARVSDLFADAKFEVQIKNTGQTPAYNVTTRTWVRMDEYPLMSALVFGEFKHAPSVSTVGAQGVNTTRLPAARRIPEDLIAETRERLEKIGNLAVYVFGVVTYEDIFGRKWETKFRVMCGGSSAIIDGMLANCEEGNEAT